MDSINARSSVARTLGGGILAIGIVIAIIGLIMLVRACVFVVGATKTTGQVVAMDRNDLSDNGPTFHPVFVFTDTGGIVHTQRSSSGSSSYTFEPGEKVTVLYDAAVPKHSKIDSFQTIWLFPLALTGFGLAVIAFSRYWTYSATHMIRLEKDSHEA
jgi:hypothetical protein